ncbi:hypothetical protein CFP56_043346 [Quercus suber]|uniref:Uncharacterized protein n=1 Tax=Quercus suber TaxID=58331 RepID=A0AAW0LJ26_QUESU
MNKCIDEFLSLGWGTIEMLIVLISFDSDEEGILEAALGFPQWLKRKHVSSNSIITPEQLSIQPTTIQDFIILSLLTNRLHRLEFVHHSYLRALGHGNFRHQQYNVP